MRSLADTPKVRHVIVPCATTECASSLLSGFSNVLYVLVLYHLLVLLKTFRSFLEFLIRLHYGSRRPPSMAYRAPVIRQQILLPSRYRLATSRLDILIAVNRVRFSESC